jgi:hypothetical protein
MRLDKPTLTTLALLGAAVALGRPDHAAAALPGPDADHPDVELMLHDEGGADLVIESAIPMWYSVSPESVFAARGEYGGLIATASPGFPGFGAGEHAHEGEEEEEGHEEHEHAPFAPNVTLYFDPVLTLRKWTVTSPTFTAAAGERVEVYKSSGPGNVFYTAITGSGFTALAGDSDGLTAMRIGTTSSTGILHEHLQWYLADPGDGTPEVGAYLLGIEVYDTLGDYERSEMIPMLFNYGLSDAQFALAVDAAAVHLNLIPEPAAGLILAGLSVLALVRRRRESHGV